MTGLVCIAAQMVCASCVSKTGRGGAGHSEYGTAFEVALPRASSSERANSRLSRGLLNP